MTPYCVLCKWKEIFQSKGTYCNIEETTGHCKLHSDTGDERLSRYNILSHQAGMRFFSPESYPAKDELQKVNNF